MARSAPIGNDNGLALKDPLIRQKAYNQFCEHLAKGKKVESWYFEEGELMCCYKTMLSYIEKNPLEFPAVKRSVAQSKGHQYWESVCESSAEGINEKANTASLQMIMRNKFGWDAKEDKSAAIPADADKVDKDNKIMELEAKLEAALSKIDNQSKTE